MDNEIHDTQAPRRPLRVDAQRNRAKIITAATRLFGERGSEASMEEIASLAGVGIGSVYRSCGSKDDLLREIYMSKINIFLQATLAAARIDDAHAAFEEYLVKTSDYLSSNRLMIELNSRLSIDPDWTRLTIADRVEAAESIFARARAEGLIHTHIQFSDIDLILRAHAKYVPLMTGIRTEVWSRHLNLLRTLCYVDEQHWKQAAAFLTDGPKALSSVEYAQLIQQQKRVAAN